jgi:hypothetical protein
MLLMALPVVRNFYVCKSKTTIMDDHLDCCDIFQKRCSTMSTVKGFDFANLIGEVHRECE